MPPIRRSSRFVSSVLILAMSASGAAPGWSQAPPSSGAPPAPLLGFTAARAAEQRALEARFDSLVRAENLREWMKRLSARPHHAGSPYGKENAEFMAGLFRSWGYDTKIEEFQVLLPTPKLRRLEMLAPTPLHRQPGRAPDPRGLDLGPDRRAAAGLQRLLDRRRRHRRGGLRQLGRARRLRGAGAPGRQRPRQDRARALRWLLARHQAQGRRRARRDRLPHLLRSARGRLSPWRRLPQGRLAARGQRAARLGRRHADPPGRPADAVRRRHQGRQAAGSSRTRRR